RVRLWRSWVWTLQAPHWWISWASTTSPTPTGCRAATEENGVTTASTFPDRCVLGAIDVSGYAASVAAYAGWAASRLGAPLELMHVIDREAAAVPIDLTGN